MQMGSLIFLWQVLFPHGKPIFSAREVPKNAKRKIGLGTELMQRNQQHTLHTNGPTACTTTVMLRDHVER